MLPNLLSGGDQILLELNENNPRHLTQMQIANSFGVCKATVSNIVKDYIEQGLDASITYKRNPNSNAKRKADGRNEARIIELACSQPLKDGLAGLCASWKKN